MNKGKPPESREPNNPAPENPKQRGANPRKRKIALLVGVGVLAVVLVVLLVATSTGQPIVCGRCHEMGEAFASWEHSVHKDVDCEDCHISPGIRAMVAAKFSSEEVVEQHASRPGDSSVIAVNVPDANCAKCHGDVPDDLESKTARITHARHVDRGIDCVFCHQGAGHEPSREALSPEMSVCNECHNGTQAPNRCGLCHVKEVPQPAPASHVELTKEELQMMPHPEGFRNAHGDLAREELARCQSCHQNRACESCHTNRIPESHARQDFRKSHAAEVASAGDTCMDCHTQKFCLVCHSQSPPASHDRNFTKTHGKLSMAEGARCNLCHKQEMCSACHNLPMPHPGNFIRGHQPIARRNSRQCTQCHTQSYCESCHSKTRPASHKARNFATTGHGPQYRQAPDKCEFCHKDQKFCDTCHSTRRPPSHQAKNFMTDHGSLYRKDQKSCAFCHKSQQFCDTCHTTVRPASHTPTWVAAHGKPAAAANANCSFCHQRDLCTKCHGQGGMKPSSHGEGYLMKHAEDARKNQKQCGLCHTAQMCNACHTPMQKPEIKFN